MQETVSETDTGYRDTYTGIATDCIRHFGLTFEEIDRLTIPEYQLMCKAYELKTVDKANDIYQQAWLTVSAGATRKDGRPVYKKFKDFFNYEAELQKVGKPKPNKFSNLSKHMKEKQQCNRK